MLVMKRTPMPTRFRTEELGGAVVPWAPVGEGSTMTKGLNDPRTSILSSEITTMGPARGQPEPVESRPGSIGQVWQPCWLTLLTQFGLRFIAF